jgi:hypothetical protein
VQLDVGLAVATRAYAAAQQTAGFVPVDGAPAGTGHVAATGVDLGGLAAGAAPEGGDPLGRRGPPPAALLFLGLPLLDCVGIGPSVAATASAQISPPGGVLTITPHQAADRLARLPVEALHGIGPRQAAVLRDYGIHSVGLLAAVPPSTVQRLLGGRAGRLATDHARGIDPRPVVPRALPASAAVRCSFDRHTLDGAAARAALLTLAVRLGARLRPPRPGPHVPSR